MFKLVLAAMLAGSTVSASMVDTQSLGFTAPQISGDPNTYVGNPTQGDIVFWGTSASTGNFWGFDGTSFEPIGGYLGNLLAVANKTSDATIAVTDDMVLVDTNGADRTMTLPDATTITGKVLRFKKTDSSTFKVTIDPYSTQTIDGISTMLLTVQNEDLSIVSDGSNWKVLSRNFGGEMVSFTPTGSWTDYTTYTGNYRKVSADRIAVWVYISVSGTPTSANLTVNIPNSSAWSIDTTKMLNATADTPVGELNALDLGNGHFAGSVRYYSTTSVGFSVFITNGTYLGPIYITQAVPMTWASGDKVIAKFEIPISGWR